MELHTLPLLSPLPPQVAPCTRLAPLRTACRPRALLPLSPRTARTVFFAFLSPHLA